MAGLQDSSLFEGRDLKPTTDLRAVLKGMLADHLGLPASLLEAEGFSGQPRHQAGPGPVGLTRSADATNCRSK
jgi:uncharacterized protein (DUF1501 family)